jgi:hypothetical protein
LGWRLLKYILLIVVAALSIVIAGAEHKDFVNAEGAHLTYDIDESGWVSNGHFEAGYIILDFADINTEHGEQQTPYITDQGFKGWLNLKFCDDDFRNHFMVELIRYNLNTRDNDWDEETWAEFWFDGNCDCH